MPRRRLAIDDGESLVELIITIAIMGISVVAIVGGFASSVRVTDMHRKESVAGAALHNYAETLSNFVAAPGYVPCASSDPVTGPYGPAAVGYSAPTDYSASIVKITYWDGSAFGPSCAASTDKGLE